MTAAEDGEQDLTRKQRREQARAQRKEMEEAAAAQTVRRTRLMQLGTVVAVVIAAVVVIAVASGGGSKKLTKHEKTAAAKEVASLVAGIPQQGNALGDSAAPVTLQYFGDLECPICKEFTLGALPALIKGDVRSGKLRIEYHSLETATREPEVFKLQQVAAYAAGKQNKAWNFIETFYHEQGEEDSGYVTENYIQGIASQVSGLNLSQWTSDRSDPELANEVSTDAQAANAAGFTGTPSFLIGKTGGAAKKFEYTSLTDPSSFEAAVEQLIKS